MQKPDINSLDLEKIIGEVEELITPVYRGLDQISLHNHSKVLKAFHKARVSEFHLKGSTGYGYGDAGRDAVESVFASVFGSEAALVRGQIVSGTHAITLCLFGILRPGDEVLSVSGAPYDTLQEVLGIRGNAPGNLAQWGIKYREVDFLPDGGLDREGIISAINKNTRMVIIQRSRGYEWRPALSISQISEVCETVRSVSGNTIIFVDNCYGEFVEETEPIEAGADLAAGSLIKNMGGGIAATGGYIVGKAELVEMAAHRLTAPGIGGEVGATLDYNRMFLQGIFSAPHIVCEAIKGAVFASALFEKMGYLVSPKYNESRSDIVQGLCLENEEQMVAFCRGLQKGSPLDGYVVPEPVLMPGYTDKVVMAGGTFIAGSTIELSADGPIREPYAIYMQGGISRDYVKLGLISAARECIAEKTKLCR
ncbi:aminotransferase class I/II-fold pyridoxal phosphate-dependent enzyme [Phosphitispora fastidiosa]|uniref:methionine gamma-lyase family protein n=1 Tax=Phosphitispora fastidiosa TaxID=2837202 RepID=UPI001E3E92BD|nr:methionine gamma-lyase family protein [Phosphitispora fastidiosa]MBU7005183.1 cystathionine beta-lyase family protein involved in aluminum resistance [Phosphitispora fastidiosa]